MKKTLTMCALLSFQMLYSQEEEINIIGIWEQLPNDSKSFKIYTDKGFYYDIYIYSNTEISITNSFYGFYVDCNPYRLDSLKLNGTGDYFFEIINEDTEIDKWGVFIPYRLSCWSITKDHYRLQDTYEPDSNYLHFGRRAILEYKQVYRLPLRLVDYIENKQKEVYDSYKSLALPTPSYNCALAGTPIEKAICNNWELSQLDRDLSKAYNKLEKTEKLQASQNKWLAKRNKLKGTKEELIKELIAMYKNRILELK